MKITNNTFRDKVLDLSVNGIYVYDLTKGINVYVNQQYTSLTGYSLNELNEMTQEQFFGLFHPDEQEMIAKHMEEVVSSELGQVIEIEYRFKKADGSWMWCLSRDAIFDRDKDEMPTQFMGTFIDITARKSIEKKLKAKNKELEEFAYIAAHDLQAPLNTIISVAELFNLQYKGVLDESGSQFLGFISDASMRMTDLIRGLLDYSRIGRGKKLTWVDCNTVVNNVLDDLRAVINKTNANIEIGELPQLAGYETELRLLFQNLISNAIKFRKPSANPCIQVAAKKGNSHWMLSFKDNGIGIPEEYKEQIFNIFQRLHSQSEYKGTGIGLAHCRKIVELHNGEIWVESQRYIGSTFYLTIPDTKPCLKN